MHRRHWLLALALALGVGLALTPAPAAESADAARVAKLIEQMGSGNFEERQKATEALEAIGLPALEALRKAAAGDDVEVKRRAGELVAKLEKKAESAAVLAPKKVHLVYKDTPLPEAVADFARKTGYTIKLHDPESKLKDRTVTLDTGETTFWHALDLFCRKAGVSEATPQDLMNPIRPLPPRPLGAPGILPVIPPAGGGAAQPLRPLPAVQPPASEDKPGAALREEIPARARALPPAPPAGAPPVAATIARPVFLGQQQGEITLVDRKPEARPTDDSSAIRVRLSQQPIAGKPADGTEIRFFLEVSPEPRLRWQNYTAVRIDKAVDDQDQKLAQGDEATPGAVGVGVGVVRPGVVRPHIRIAPWGLNPVVPVLLKKGDKESKSLKELSGAITANLLTDPRDFIAVENVLKAAGKTARGTEGGSIQVTDVTRGEDDQVTIAFEVEHPTGVMAENNPTPLATPPVPLPRVVPPPAPPVPAPAGAAPAPAAPPVGEAIKAPKIGVAVGGPAIAVPPGGFVSPVFQGPVNGMVLLDDKDNILPVQMQLLRAQSGPGGTTMSFQAVYKPEKGKPAPARLAFRGRKSVTIDVPFTLKDITLP